MAPEDRPIIEQVLMGYTAEEIAERLDCSTHRAPGPSARQESTRQIYRGRENQRGNHMTPREYDDALRDVPGQQPESLVWTELQNAVSSIRQALGRGERPAIEVYVPSGTDHRREIVLELVYEEMEFRSRKVRSWSFVRIWDAFPSLPTIRMRSESWSRPDRICAGGCWLGLGPGPRRRPDEPGGPTTDPVRPLRVGGRDRSSAFGLVYRCATRRGEDSGPEAASTGCAGGDWSRRAVPAQAENAAGLRHPHIVAVYDVGQFNGEPYLVSTLIEGKNLADHASERRPGPRQAAEWVASLANALGMPMARCDPPRRQAVERLDRL